MKRRSLTWNKEKRKRRFSKHVRINENKKSSIKYSKYPEKYKKLALSISLWKTNNHYLFLWLFKVWQRLSSFQDYLFWFLQFCRIMVFYIQNFSARSWAYHKQKIILKGFVRDVETYFTIMILLEKFWIMQYFNLYWIWKLRIYRQIQNVGI